MKAVTKTLLKILIALGGSLLLVFCARFLWFWIGLVLAVLALPFFYCAYEIVEKRMEQLAYQKQLWNRGLLRNEKNEQLPEPRMPHWTVQLIECSGLAAILILGLSTIIFLCWINLPLGLFVILMLWTFGETIREKDKMESHQKQTSQKITPFQAEIEERYSHATFEEIQKIMNNIQNNRLS